MYYITLEPGDVAVVRSEDTLLNYQMYFPVQEWSLEETTEQVNVLVHAEGSADKQWFTKGVIMSPSVVKLDGEYVAKYIDEGCVVLEGKEVCISVGEHSVIFSVDGESEEFALYSLFIEWLNKVFGGGAISSWLEVGDVQIKLYEEYIRIEL